MKYELVTNWVNGQKSPGNGQTLDVYSPRENTIIAQVKLSNRHDVGEVIEIAKKAQKEWGLLTFKKRAEYIMDLRSEFKNNTERLIEAIQDENGKTYGEAEAEVLKAIELCEFAASVPSIISGRNQYVSTGIEVKELNEPVGIVASITPFNFPLMVPMWTIPNVLVTGNAIIVKPSEKTPITTSIVAELVKNANIPDGLFNVIQGDKEVVEAICEDKEVKTVTFVGSTPVAASVYRQSTHNLKRCLAMGGAKNHIIVTPEVDPIITAQEILSAAFGMSGQRCMAASTVVTVGHNQELIDELIKQTKKDYIPGQTMGPLIDQGAVKNVCDFLDKTKGNILLDGRDFKTNSEGYYIGGSIIQYEKSTEMPEEEVFGPTIEIIECDTLEEAVAIQNMSPYANGASIFTDTGEYAMQATLGFSSGMLGVNIGVPVPRDPYSFGGLKASKFGVGDITGFNSIPLYVNTKKITTKWNPNHRKDWMS